MREARSPSGALAFVSGSARLELIADMAVTDVESGKSLRLGEAGELYSAEWLAAMGEPREVLPINRTKDEDSEARQPLL